MPEIRLREPRFYLLCLWNTSSKQTNTKFKATWDYQKIYQKELDKACFQHDMAYGDYKDYRKRTAA